MILHVVEFAALIVATACFAPHFVPIVRHAFESSERTAWRLRQEIAEDNAAGIAARRISDMQRTYPSVPR